MKLSLFKKVILLSVMLLTLVFLITGCATAEMKVNNDGSGEIKYLITANGMMPQSQIKDEIDKNIKDENKRRT